VETVNAEAHFDKPVDGCGTEAAAKEVFMKFCPNGEMDSKTFIKMCEDASLLGKGFTRTDADLLFQKAKAKASAPGAGSYSSGVVHGKRLSYDVIRAVAIPDIAVKKNKTVPQLLEVLAACPGPTLRGTTQVADVRFHDDKTTFTGAQAAAQATH
jgi:hypothetical protein